MITVEKIKKTSVVFVALTTIFIFPIFMDPINLPKFFILLIGGSIITYVLSTKIIYLRNIFSKFFLVVLTVYIFLLLVSALFSDQSFFATLTGTWGRNNGIITTFLFIIYFVVFTIPTKKDVNSSLLQTLYYLGLFSITYAWIQYLDKDPMQYYFPWYNKNDSIVITVGNSNFASIFLAMTFSASLAVFLKKPGLNHKTSINLFSLVAHVLLIPKLDTQGKISFAIGVFVVIGVMTISSKDKYWKSFNIAWWSVGLLLGILGLLGLSGKGYFAGVLSDNVRALTDRYYAWKAAIRMMQDSPIFGKGIDSFGFYYRNFRDKNSSEIISNQPFITYDNAHNTYLQLGATAGIPILIIYLVLVAAVCWRMLKAWKYSQNKSVVAGLSSIWIIYLVQSIVSMDQIGIAIWGWVCAGALVSISQKIDAPLNEEIKDSNDNAKVKTKNYSKIVYGPLGALIFSLPVIYYVPVIQNESQIYFGIRNIPRLLGESEKSKNFERIVKLGYETKQLELRLTIIRYLGGVNLNDKALELALFSSKQEPRSFAAWHLVAGLYEISGQYQLAIPAREETIKLDPYNAPIKDLLALNIQASKLG